VTGTQDMAMPYRRLGRSNLQVSALCLGTMMFGDQTGREEAAGILADARAQGVNFIDTACSTKGASEATLGEPFVGSGTTGCWRPSWATKCRIG
jgi:aryl-alcohol dehydrogenase-like predicted oxidoreductase